MEVELAASWCALVNIWNQGMATIRDAKEAGRGWNLRRRYSTGMMIIIMVEHE